MSVRTLKVAERAAVSPFHVMEILVAANARQRARGDVVFTTGSSGGFLLAFLAAFDVGDRVAVARPGYPAYRNILAALGAEVVDLPCGEATRFRPTVELLEALPRLDGLVLASPANPT